MRPKKYVYTTELILESIRLWAWFDVYFIGLFCFSSWFQGSFKWTIALSLAVIKYILNDLWKEMNLFVNCLNALYKLNPEECHVQWTEDTIIKLYLH